MLSFVSGKFLWKSCGIIIALLNRLYKLVNSGRSALCSGIIAIFIGFMFLLFSNYGLNFFLFSGFTKTFIPDEINMTRSP